MDYGKKAEQLFRDGYNCSQAVVLAFADQLDADKNTLLLIASSFGGGMARMREVCGAISGMFMVAGLKQGFASPKDIEGKADHYKNLQKLAEAFKEENGDIKCRDLLGLPTGPDIPTPSERTPDYYKRRPCVELVRSAANILAKELNLD